MNRTLFSLKRCISAMLSILVLLTVIPSVGMITASAATPKIWLDAGHGGKDSGALHYNGSGNIDRMEKDDSLDLVLEVGKILEKYGVSVGYSRKDDTFIELDDRGPLANAFGADYFVSIHRNSADPDVATGIETYYHTSQTSDSDSAKLAGIVQNKLVDASGLRNRGVKTADFSVLRRSDMPAILIETGFISTSSDNEVLDSKRVEIVEAIAGGILEICNISFTPSGNGASGYKVNDSVFMINDGDSLKGWKEEYNSEASLEAGYDSQGNSIQMRGLSPTAFDNNIGAMLRCHYTDALDLSKYESIAFDYYVSKDIGGKSSGLQLNFCTDSSDDGFTVIFGMDNDNAGWHTYIVKREDITRILPTADWSRITDLRLTWWNYTHIEGLDIRIDNIIAYNHDKNVEKTLLGKKFDEVKKLGEPELTVKNAKIFAAPVRAVEKMYKEYVSSWNDDPFDTTWLNAAIDRINIFNKVFGDVDHDENVTASDALMILQASVNVIRLSSSDVTIADVNEDSRIGINDALLVLRYAVGKSDSLPVHV